MGKTLATILVVGLLLIAAVTGFLLVQAVRGVTQVPGDVVGGVATSVQQIIHPTPTIYPSPVTVIHEVRALARLESAQYTIEKVITAETGQGTLGALFGDRLLLVAHGQVIAGVDLARLQSSDITVTPDGRATIIMPAAEVFVATLDNDKSYVYDRETGLLTRGDTNLETQARQVAQDEILRAALEDGILQLAQSNAEAFLRSLLLSFGYTEVTVIYGTPSPAAAPTVVVTP
jgi:hypothetical protein